jgi:hypothetical protein
VLVKEIETNLATLNDYVKSGLLERKLDKFVQKDRTVDENCSY